jgi:hypothetical protein
MVWRVTIIHRKHHVTLVLLRLWSSSLVPSIIELWLPPPENEKRDPVNAAYRIRRKDPTQN